MLTTEKIDKCIEEARRFIDKATEAKTRLHLDRTINITGCRETAACKRASMDLSHALVKLRNKN